MPCHVEEIAARRLALPARDRARSIGGARHRVLALAGDELHVAARAEGASRARQDDGADRVVEPQPVQQRGQFLDQLPAGGVQFLRAVERDDPDVLVEDVLEGLEFIRHGWFLGACAGGRLPRFSR